MLDDDLVGEVLQDANGFGTLPPSEGVDSPLDGEWAGPGRAKIKNSPSDGVDFPLHARCGIVQRSRRRGLLRKTSAADLT